jgi:hypothetical protein
MKVSDLAADLEIPPSAVLEQCQRFGIDASWAGAELSGSDVVVLRAELAASDPIDLTSADAPAQEPADADLATSADATASDRSASDAAASDATSGVATTIDVASGGGEPEIPAAPADAPAEAPVPTMADESTDPGPGAAQAIPPTAVGSMPELIEEITPPAEAPAPGPSGLGPGPRGGSPGQHGLGIDPDASRRVAPRDAPAKRQLARSSRNSVIALVVGAACFGASNFTEVPAVVGLLWVLAAVSFVVAVVDGFRGRRKAQVHPERHHGVWLGTISLVLAMAAVVAMTGAVLAVTGDDAAAEAPAGLGDLKSVQVGRWGYQRLQRYADDGWKQPAREEGSCWGADDEERDEQRVELVQMSDATACNTAHTLEVMRVFAVNRDADARYPGTAELLVIGNRECKAIADRLEEKGVDAEVKVEYPTEVGWGDGDHDVACVAVTPTRSKPLGS